LYIFRRYWLFQHYRLFDTLLPDYVKATFLHLF